MKFDSEKNENKVDYRDITEKRIQDTFKKNSNSIVTSLLEVKENEEVKKESISIYFESDDINVLKAVAQIKKTTINKLVLDVLKPVIDTTRIDLEDSEDIEKLAKSYDKRKKGRGRKIVK
ncbi:TPA: hypothetical protein ACKFUW_003515 [Clostridioides difficile]|uniref:Uncharacterized protein n=1 Tax=Clostridioides difficile TaxID=1496 RepID=A0A9X8RIX7_CLODI|nr:hypothetical protein [Clostridioides difficile]MCE0818733.1 hypothetical protein [Clostridioides difficile]MCI2349230.1 hypothetical protein [Clostridioides difficile]MCI4729995.1 hypothetical protein [Clostridioides difficile]MCI4737587.1 hypothetical protein [Clostridioides difficile]MCI4840546.1 hypothetical protein [Clostridioides difficile]